MIGNFKNKALKDHVNYKTQIITYNSLNEFLNDPNKPGEADPNILKRKYEKTNQQVWENLQQFYPNTNVKLSKVTPKGDDKHFIIIKNAEITDYARGEHNEPDAFKIKHGNQNINGVIVPYNTSENNIVNLTDFPKQAFDKGKYDIGAQVLNDNTLRVYTFRKR